MQGIFPNVHYHTLVVNDLLGNPVEMRRRAFMKGGQPRIEPDGKISFYYEDLPEQKALERWQDGEFLEIEQEFAKEWRTALSNLKFDQMIGIIKNIVPQDKKFHDLEEVK